jgi:hypothetical protein
MSFYLTLPSNSSKQEYPENRQSNYTTLIKQPINLNGPYEVALVDITYSPQITIELGYIHVPNPFVNITEPWADRDQTLEIKITAMNGDTSEKFFYILTNEIIKLNMYNEYLFRYNCAFEPSRKQRDKIALLMADQKRKSSESKDHLPHLIVFDRGPSFEILFSDPSDEFYHKLFTSCGGHYNDTMEKYLFNSVDALAKLTKLTHLAVPSDISRHPSGFLQYLDFNDFKEEFESIVHLLVDASTLYVAHRTLPYFTFKQNFLEVDFKNYHGLEFFGLIKELIDDHLFGNGIIKVGFMPTLNIQNYAAVYCDLIADQYIGDVIAPIIRIINLGNIQGNDTITFYDNPHYVNCKKSTINSINIRILDLQGNPIKFENKFSYVILKLHLRKQNE